MELMAAAEECMDAAPAIRTFWLEIPVIATSPSRTTVPTTVLTKKSVRFPDAAMGPKLWLGLVVPGAENPGLILGVC